ncbi:restriction endonuclease subunit S [Aromatoleum toluclasticum]|uniref:restriction endonuclease subunit S n=1 Tax=Aromatoleum toluclasticum TaxID=92003 RepID=UPI001D192A83|nr:restriction endonuclease subunit S [Aromatoleum toluclasticum]MCC4115354.1 restriction endonuclease subunit S [Aromatoleum toluclasticum]
MSLPKYGVYADSGVAWLGVVPAHWQVQRLRHLFEIRKRIVGEEGHRVLSITQRGIKVKDIESNDGQLSMDYSKYQTVHPGDFAMNHMDLLTGFVDISPYSGVTSPDYRVFAVRDGVPCEPRYFLHLLQNGYRQKVFYAFGQGASEFGRWRFPTDQFNDFRFPCPPPDEQRTIASFLDCETAKIDALIAEQEKLIALLTEKRRATISHLVTKGLNPEAPMRDSGVAWLGEVPAHWQVKKLRHIADVVRGASPRPAGDPEFFDSDNESGLNRPWVTVAEVTKDESPYLTEVTEYLTPAGVERSQSFASGTLIFTNSGATLGVPKILSVNCCANDGILAFKGLSSDVEIRFLYLFLLTTTERLRTEMKQGGGQPNLNTGIVKDISFPLPPITEQRKIIDYVETRLGEFDALRAEAARATALLAERRGALISAAVTGKIDVRSAVTC